ncbi:MAG TPA: hypothetical protein VFE13_14375, partial [Caulobacteraceae bacterium]|nr:hypothetical protein [Caulobacteraceae bacterium]
DPDWVRRRDEDDRRHAAEVRMLRAEMKPEETALRRDLAQIGFPIRSVSDLVNMDAPYPPGTAPILVRHLQQARHPVQRNCLARALTVEEAEGIAGKPILQELRRETDSEARFAMANALTLVATPDDADEIAALVEDPAYADVRERLDQALGNVRPGRRKKVRRRATFRPRPATWWGRLGLRPGPFR